MTARAMTDTGMRTTIRADARPRPSGAKVRSARSAWPTSAVACGHRRWPPSAFRPIKRSQSCSSSSFSRPSVVLTPVVVSLALGDRSRDLLDALRGWMARNSSIVMAVLFLVIGAKLIGDAISGFA